ncbi:MAG TPA: hypothetical protein VK607_10525 [Kofleriaceae bacterium]|nr:hypothetical protein [Kofleriaceae bacterium]
MTVYVVLAVEIPADNADAAESTLGVCRSLVGACRMAARNAEPRVNEDAGADDVQDMEDPTEWHALKDAWCFQSGWIDAEYFIEAHELTD